MYIKQTLPAIAIIIFAVILRLVPHIPNIAPITALALFGGLYLNKKFAVVVPLIALFLSDMVLGFYKGMFFVYGSFLLIGLIGLFIQRHRSANRIVGATLAASTLFFVITNFGVWLQSGMYPHTWAGFINCYTLALPFFRNTLIGDGLYMGLFVVAYEAILMLLGAKQKISLMKKRQVFNESEVSS